MTSAPEVGGEKKSASALALSVDDALARVTADLEQMLPEIVPLALAGGRVLATNLAAKLTQPPFAASAMDGFAVRAEDITDLPATLSVIGEAAAGHMFTGAVGPGETVRIFTGAPVPDGADTVVIQENTEREADSVRVLEGANLGAHIRHAGYDFREGEVLLEKGTMLNERALTLVASMNYDEVPVYRKPVVAILATGDELQPPGSELASDQIISSIPYGLKILVERAGGEALLLGIAKDELESLSEAIARARQADILVTIGGASVGDHDLVQKALTSAGMTLDFWKIAMRPGKPLMFGALGKMKVLGLPGNPVSALICGRIFMSPMIKTMTGRRQRNDTLVDVRLASPLPANGKRQHYMRGQLSSEGDKQTVCAMEDQDSSLMATFARANCLIVRPVDAPAADIGDFVPVIVLD